jgi:hypothetical protein
MGNSPHQIDDLDFLLRDLLRQEAAASGSRAKVWVALRNRIEARHQPVRRHITLGTHSYLSPREWTLDCHLMSMARMVH